MCPEIDICPDLLLAAIAAFSAAAFFGLYMAITAAGRRRKRSADAGAHLYYAPVSALLDQGLDLSVALGAGNSLGPLSFQPRVHRQSAFPRSVSRAI